jgi:hypothetical protein
VQYPFSENEKVVIKVRFLRLICYYLLAMTDSTYWIDISKAILNYAGKQEDARKICWEGSDHHIPVSQWLVSGQDLISFTFMALYAF